MKYIKNSMRLVLKIGEWYGTLIWLKL